MHIFYQDKGSVHMNEVKSPKKPLVYYYAIVILVILALNFLAVPG